MLVPFFEFQCLIQAPDGAPNYMDELIHTYCACELNIMKEANLFGSTRTSPPC